jgi:hypothetical protein
MCAISDLQVNLEACCLKNGSVNHTTAAHPGKGGLPTANESNQLMMAWFLGGMVQTPACLLHATVYGSAE